MALIRLGACVAMLLGLLACGRSHAAGIVKGPYLQNPTTSSITVCWVSDTPTTGVVTYQQSPRRPTEIKEKTSAQYHRVKLEKLRANATYAYQVKCEGATAQGTFRTASTPGRTVRFVAYGDNRSQPTVHKAVLKNIAAFKPDFVLQSGDMVANGEVQEQWDEYWRTVEPEIASLPMYTVLGNHERSGAPYFRYFDVPRDYAFDYGDIHFVALDSNRPSSEVPAQMEWLKKDLAAHQKAAWRVLFMHHTLYTCVDMPLRLVESAERRKTLEPILQQGHVQLVISGHDHDYQHHFANGIHYIVSGGGGAPLYNIKPTPTTVSARKVHHHCEIVEEPDRLQIRAVDVDGGVFDQWVIDHP